MKYIETFDKEFMLTPRGHFSHAELASIGGLLRQDIRSAGFMIRREALTEPWLAYGESVSLKLPASDLVDLHDVKLFTGIVARTGGVQYVVFATSENLLQSCAEVKPAGWAVVKDLSGIYDDVIVPQFPGINTRFMEYYG